MRQIQRRKENTNQLNIEENMAFRVFAIRRINVKKEKIAKNRKKRRRDSKLRPNMRTMMISRLV